MPCKIYYRCKGNLLLIYEILSVKLKINEVRYVVFRLAINNFGRI